MIKERLKSLFFSNKSIAITGLILLVLLGAGMAAQRILNSHPTAEPAQASTPAENTMKTENTTSAVDPVSQLADTIGAGKTQKETSLSSPVEFAADVFALNKQRMTLRLYMTEGSHTTDAFPGPFGEDYYEGNLIGRLYDGHGNIIAITDLTPFFSEPLIFNKQFGIAFDDYNGDGQPDFTVGQYMGSNYRFYNIFTVRQDGKIEKLPVENNPDGVVSSGSEDQDGYYSVRLLKTTGNGFSVSLRNMEKGIYENIFYQWSENEFKLRQKPEISQLDQTLLELKSGEKINAGKLIEKLDFTADETLSYLYYSDPGKIKPEQIYEESFTTAGSKELLVIFKLTGLPHAGGLDSAVAAIFDGTSLELITQKSFVSDESQFQLLKDSKGHQYLLYSGTTTYQGASSGNLQLLDLTDNWKPSPGMNYSNEQNLRKFQLLSEGMISVLSQDSNENGEFKWYKTYYLKWNPETASFIDYMPDSYKDRSGEPYFDRESLSPDGKYAASAHGWGFDENSYILIYDTFHNKLVHRYDILSSDFGYAWSPDSRKLCVKSMGRVWIDTVVLDIEKNNLVNMLDISSYEKLTTMGIKFSYELHENRPDPYIQPVEWSPDSQRVLMHYQWTDNQYIRQSGTFIYVPGKKIVSNVVQNKGITESDHLEPLKPAGFKW